MFCKKCGTQLHEQARFCKKCGTAVTATKPISAFQQPIAAPTPTVPPPTVIDFVAPLAPAKKEAEIKPASPPPAPVKPAPPPSENKVVEVLPVPPPPTIKPAPSLPAKQQGAESKPAPPPPIKVVPPPLLPTEDLAPPPAPVEKKSVSSIAAPATIADQLPESKSDSKRWLFVTGVGLVVVAVAGVFWWMRSDSQTAQPAQTTAQSNLSAPQGMVYVPGGELMMGNDSGEVQERPAHKVVVQPFFIDRNEMTCEEYAKFVAATGHRAPATWTDGNYPEGAALRPVTGVDWDDANAYAAWAGKRLPTEQEWEFAARGTEGRRYPWGNEWRPNQANDISSGLGQTANVGSYPSGASPFGANDLVGNAWEWTANDYVPYPGGQLPQASPSGNLKVIRGSAFGGDQEHATTTFRMGWPMRGAEDYSKTGFRCVKDAPR
ncbi:MAG: SUMF1/EgtB/PvdO family nonheme iron enzyme [Acidobacteria bacterium]|nr:SUMF1/EgtB/PvdO family nonheme iron enzyme [Acidobacteriota bacterium]